MKRYQFYIGTLDKNRFEKIKSDKEFVTVFDALFENYTLQLAQGRYTMHDINATTIKEKTFIVTVVDVYDKTMLKFLTDNLKILLNQESILVTEENLTSVKFM